MKIIPTNVQAHTRASETPELEKEPGGALCDAACSALPIPEGAISRISVVTEVFRSDGRSDVESIVTAWYSQKGCPLSSEEACRLVDERTADLVSRQGVSLHHHGRKDLIGLVLDLDREYYPPQSLVSSDIALLEKVRQTAPSAFGALLQCGGREVQPA